MLEQQKKNEVSENLGAAKKAAQQTQKSVKPAAEVTKTKIEKLESMITELEVTRAAIESEMEGCAEDYSRIDTLYRQRVELENQLDGLYKEWAEL